MHRLTACAAAILGSAALAAQPAALPTPGKSPAAGGSNDYKLLLAMKGVQKELGLKAEQVKAIDGLGSDVSARFREASRGLDKTIPNAKDRIAKRAELREKFDKEYHDGLAKQLNAAQFKRLGQIRLQADAPGSIAWPSVEEKLKLTADQKAGLEKVNRFLGADRLNVTTKELRDTRNDPVKQAAFDQKLRDLTAKYTADALNLLDADQRKKWQELTGEAFDLSKVGFGAILKD